MIVGFVGVVTFVGALLGGSDNLVFWVSKFDALFYSATLIFIATWLQIGTIHHLMLERKGEVI